MAILQVRDIDDHLYESLKAVAKAENRSISQQVISILGSYLANPAAGKGSPTRDFLALSGAWADSRQADEIITDLVEQRKNSGRFGGANALFD